MLALQLLLFLLGVVLLTGGAEFLVRGGARLATAFRVSPLVIGLTIVAFGTSAPELVVSVAAAWRGESTIALGKVVGSNIFNILGILGPAALIAPLAVQAAVVRREVPIMVGVSLLPLLLGFNGVIGRGEGVLLLIGIVAYTWFSYATSRRETAAVVHEYEESLPVPHPRSRLWIDVLLVAFGLVLLVVGAQVLINAAIPIARALGISERVISLTLVAAGTSMPEFATSMVATFRRQTDIAVGNVVGSNVFNVLSILGAASLVQPLSVPAEMLRIDIPVMMATCAALLPIVMTRHRISRGEGAVLLASLAAYFGYLIAAA